MSPREHDFRSILITISWRNGAILFQDIRLKNLFELLKLPSRQFKVFDTVLMLVLFNYRPT